MEIGKQDWVISEVENGSDVAHNGPVRNGSSLWRTTHMESLQAASHGKGKEKEIDLH
ncbi:acyl dehydratase [Sesbania bispinosa]|nr:acyl dehydratase [Sesbania bispinosa]